MLYTAQRLFIEPNRRHSHWQGMYLLLTCVFVIGLIWGCQANPPLLSGKLPIIAPAAITVGDSVDVTVGPVSVIDGTQIGLVMVGKYGPRIYVGKFNQGVAHFTIPGEHTLQPGYLALIAAVDSARGEVGVLLRPKANDLNTSNFLGSQVNITPILSLR